MLPLLFFYPTLITKFSENQGNKFGAQCQGLLQGFALKLDLKLGIVWYGHRCVTGIWLLDLDAESGKAFHAYLVLCLGRICH